MNAFKYFTITECLFRRVPELSRENEREGLLPDCNVGVKESESEDDSSWMLAACTATF